MKTPQSILITGGGGYVGSALVPALLKKGHRVKPVDLFWYGEDVFADCNRHPSLQRIKADIRDAAAMDRAMEGVDAVIHLACISNDPSFDLDPHLGKSINLDCFPALLDAAMKHGVKRFIYASSSSVYGVKEEPDVREDAEPLPLTDYSKFKLECERIFLERVPKGKMVRSIIRPATVCGYAPRMRLDLTVNILTIHALVNRKIRIFGGKQLRPNLNILDMVGAYELFLDAPAEKIDGVPFNVGFENRTVEDIAHMVKRTIGDEGIALQFEESSDNRSYHVNSDRVRDVLGFRPRYTIEDAIRSVVEAYRAGLFVDPMNNPVYVNIKRMKQLALA
jgi:nucleoside-diphosphate-sugar epimerase